MRRDDLVNSLKALRPQFEAEGVRHLSLFGSRARGDNKPDSDLDIMLDVDAAIKFSLIDLIGIEHMVSDETGIATNAVVRRGMPDRFGSAISSDLIEIF